MSGARKKGGIPDRWLDYTAVGSRLTGTRFIAFKVPLKQALNHHLDPSQVFSHWDLLDSVSRHNQQLGLIIDLTFTTRYYSLQDVPDSLLVLKIFTGGHQVPSDATILNFKQAVRTFLTENQHNDKLIGVHCTHGVNRTGYLICRYLIDVEGMEPEVALQLFQSSRSHGVERSNYLQDLRTGPKRSNSGMELSELQPQRGESQHRPNNSSDSDDTKWSVDRNHSRNHSRSPPSNHHCNPYPPHHPPGPYQWIQPDDNLSRSRYPSQGRQRSRYPSQDQERSRYQSQDKQRSRSPSQDQEKFRYSSQDHGGSSYPLQNQHRPRYPTQYQDRPRYTPPNQERLRYASQKEGGFRYPLQGQERSRYTLQTQERSRYHLQDQEMSRYPLQDQYRSRYPQQDQGMPRYTPYGPSWGCS